MAQWSGQFSGRTHATKVEDLEEAVSRAAAALRVARERETNDKSKAIHKLAERLLQARLKELKASISEEALGDREARTVRLSTRRDELIASGVAGILREFNVPINIQ